MAKTPNDTSFFKSLQKFAAKIKKRAAGRSCRDCRHYSFNCNDCLYPWDGDFAVSIYYADAVACSHWEAR